MAAAEFPPQQQRPDEGRNTALILAGNALQQVGDQAVNAKTVLPWLLTGLGAPTAFASLLVPVRESGSMLPQAALEPLLTSRRHRKQIWMLGAIGQGLAALGIAVVAASASGFVAGVAILVLVAFFALSRSLSSLSIKDLMGRLVSKGRRGRVSGITTAVGGAVAIALGGSLRIWGSATDVAVLAWVLVGASMCWGLAFAAFLALREPAAAPEPRDRAASWLRHSWELVSGDRALRRFVMVRALLLVSALAPPLLVAASTAAGPRPLMGLGGFVVASGIGALIGGQVFGHLADRSSRLLMVGCAGVASVVSLVAAALIWTNRASLAALAIAFFVVALSHSGVRVGRSTYLVDMTEGDLRNQYVAVSNSAIGVLLLAVGAISSALSVIGTPVALAFLGLLGLTGAALAYQLPRVSNAER